MMKRLLDRYCRLLKIVLTLLMAFMIVPVAIQILSRYTGLVPRYIWTEEVARFCFVWIIMIGAMVAVRDGTHFDVDLMPHPKTKREQGVAKLIVHLAMSIMAIVFTWYGVEFARFGAIQTSEMSGINMLSIYVSFPLAGVTWIVFLVEKIVEDVVSITAKPESNL
jgi:TRAP-type C4-dicarboxylate transport system permease small subunit